ncbi:MAG TPA: c-type cytochrome [Gemmatimonadaceae bacterium]|jgi:tetratricopeptide (TPR) repeat protein|nr:c-type cytochrome [Gemmatimonadaceae bacterium]
MRRSIAFATACVAVLSSISLAQWPPDRLQNIKALPADISVRALVDTMAGFTRALGVRCTYCHVGREGIPLAQYDFVTDSLPAKRKTREMLRMVSAINADLLTKVPERRTPVIAVDCVMCHHGVAQPRPLQQLLLTAYDAGGVDSTEAAYRALRQRYYGSAAYDFGEVPLTDVAAAVRGRDRLADALRLYKLNVAFLPASGFALRQAAGAELIAGDTATAIASLQRALEINENDGQAKTALDALRRKP